MFTQLESEIPATRSRWYESDVRLAEMINRLTVSLAKRMTDVITEGVAAFRTDASTMVLDEKIPESYVPSLFMYSGVVFDPNESVMGSIKKLVDIERQTPIESQRLKHAEVLRLVVDTWNDYRAFTTDKAGNAILVYNLSHATRLEDVLNTVTWAELWSNPLWEAVPADDRMKKYFPILGKTEGKPLTPIGRTSSHFTEVMKQAHGAKVGVNQTTLQLMSRALACTVAEDCFAKSRLYDQSCEFEQLFSAKKLEDFITSLETIPKRYYEFRTLPVARDAEVEQWAQEWIARLGDARSPAAVSVASIASIVAEVKTHAVERLVHRGFDGSAGEFKIIESSNYITAYYAGEYIHRRYDAHFRELHEIENSYHRRERAHYLFLLDPLVKPGHDQMWKEYYGQIAQFHETINRMNARGPDNERQVNDAFKLRNAIYAKARRTDLGRKIEANLNECLKLLDSVRDVSTARQIIAELKFDTDLELLGPTTKRLEDTEKLAHHRALTESAVMNMWSTAVGTINGCIELLREIRVVFSDFIARRREEHTNLLDFLKSESRRPLFDSNAQLLRYSRTLPMTLEKSKALRMIVTNAKDHHRLVTSYVDRESSAETLAAAAEYKELGYHDDRRLQWIGCFLPENRQIAPRFSPLRPKVIERSDNYNVKLRTVPVMRAKEADFMNAVSKDMKERLEGAESRKMLGSNQTAFETVIHIVYLEMLSSLLAARAKTAEAVFYPLL